MNGKRLWPSVGSGSRAINMPDRASGAATAWRMMAGFVTGLSRMRPIGAARVTITVGEGLDQVPSAAAPEAQP